GIPNLARGVDLDQLEKALREQIEQLQQTPPSQQDLNRVQAQMTAGPVYAQDSLRQPATEIGKPESIGLPWTPLAENHTALQAIATEQISEVARRYLAPARLTRAHILPTATEEPP